MKRRRRERKRFSNSRIHALRIKGFFCKDSMGSGISSDDATTCGGQTNQQKRGKGELIQRGPPHYEGEKKESRAQVQALLRIAEKKEGDEILPNEPLAARFVVRFFPPREGEAGYIIICEQLRLRPPELLS